MMLPFKIGYLWLAFILSLHLVTARKHHLEINNDVRRYIALSTFGFYKGGILDVKFHDFLVFPTNEEKTFGFSLDRTMSDSMNPYLDAHQDKCLLVETASSQQNGPIIFIKLALDEKVAKVGCSKDWHNVHIYKNRSEVAMSLRQGLVKMSDSRLFNSRTKRENMPMEEENSMPSGCNQLTLPLTFIERNGLKYFSLNFVFFVFSEEEEGLYNLYFHSCPNYNYPPEVPLNFKVEIEENNMGNYLSAGEMALPALYFMMSILFLLSGLFWVFILRKSKHPVYKIHYLMAVLVFLKSLSLLFHAINYHFIEIKGEHVAAWAILFYITHLLKGAVLFTTIVLIGTGWTFIKHILADRDKKLFMIVIPLQVLANIAEIIIAESEEGDIEHRTWGDIFILVDLLCCGAILFPVVWSIKHLQEASATDGKAAINLKKLKLFRQFYIMIVGYIYFTRIIVYLLQVTVAFQLAWMDEMFREMATYVFFVMTGYKFRPASSHPYFSVETDDEEDDDGMDQALTESGLTEGVKKLTNRSQTTYMDEGSKEEERENLISKRESSHDYD